MNSIADAGRELWAKTQRSENSTEKSIAELCEELCSHKGEAMGTALACAVVSAYLDMDDKQRLDFFNHLARDYNPDKVNIQMCAQAYKDTPDQANLEALSRACESPRRELFRRINMSQRGTPTLVAMRHDVLTQLKTQPQLKPLDSDLKYLLESWFNRGFLRIQAIDWKTPAHILEKLIAYEAVHEMSGWDDLRRRLADDRRCFAFFHPGLEDEPLIFVEVALVKGLATAVQPLLAPMKAGDKITDRPDTAIFYSISNCQQGLKGISFGNFLIKQVVMELRQQLPGLKQFATLSPIPGFKPWLDKAIAKGLGDLVTVEEFAVLKHLKQDNWAEMPDLLADLKPVLTRLCAHYLVNEKRGYGPLDPVARFHLGNGAQIEQLNWMGDTSANGLRQSAGLLVNYGYHLDHVEENHEAFVNENKIAHAKAIRSILE
jgi:malonyl-CoA decarboxylase